MDAIRINRNELLSTLKANREKHEVDYLEAKAGWVEAATKALRKAADKAEKKGKIKEQPLLNLPKPESYLESYDDAIARVERDVRDELELSDQEFAAWVQDKWRWRGAFLANTSSYLAGRGN